MISEKLSAIQSQLKAPKGQFNSFGKYKYRSCEDILESLKPILSLEKCSLVLSDDVLLIGNRYYIKATATLSDGQESVSNCAFAREDEQKKGMDGSQITGTASSYARKYALNGLFCIDDTKDADTDENHNQQENAPAKPIICEACGKPIEEKSGWAPERIVAYSKRRFGKSLCAECQKKETETDGGVMTGAEMAAKMQEAQK